MPQVIAQFPVKTIWKMKTRIKTKTMRLERETWEKEKTKTHNQQGKTKTQLLLNIALTQTRKMKSKTKATKRTTLSKSNPKKGSLPQRKRRKTYSKRRSVKKSWNRRWKMCKISLQSNSSMKKIDSEWSRYSLHLNKWSDKLSRKES